MVSSADLYFFEEYTMKLIGKEFRISKMAVSKRLKKLMSRMRGLIAKDKTYSREKDNIQAYCCEKCPCMSIYADKTIMKTKRFNFRGSDTMDALIRKKAADAGTSITDHIVLFTIDKRVINFDGLRELTTQIKKLGSNGNLSFYQPSEISNLGRLVFCPVLHHAI